MPGFIFVLNPFFNCFIVPIPHLAPAKLCICAKNAGFFCGVGPFLSLSQFPFSHFPFKFHKLVTFRIASPAGSVSIFSITRHAVACLYLGGIFNVLVLTACARRMIQRIQFTDSFPNTLSFHFPSEFHEGGLPQSLSESPRHGRHVNVPRYFCSRQ